MSRNVNRVTEGFFARARACLAPMAGYSDAPFRLICSELGADFAFTGLVSADGLARGQAGSEALMRRIEGEAPLGVQLFGAGAETMGRAAAVAEREGASFVDLNFGCPAKKVIRKNGGAALMRDIERMAAIAQRVVSEVSIPVTAKIRSGWNAEERNFLDAGIALEQCGLAAITLHPRSRSEGFSGRAHWEEIASLRERVSIPVIANGDIKTLSDYRSIGIDTGCSCVMIGRGALGNPWIFRQIRDDAGGGTAREASRSERLDLLERHIAMQVDFFGERVGVREMRKFYRWYLKSFEGVKKYRAALSVAETRSRVIETVAALREELEEHGRSTAQKAS
jgi:tRNA-dihydrouridine synthase B